MKNIASDVKYCSQEESGGRESGSGNEEYKYSKSSERETPPGRNRVNAEFFDVFAHLSIAYRCRKLPDIWAQVKNCLFKIEAVGVIDLNDIPVYSLNHMTSVSGRN